MEPKRSDPSAGSLGDPWDHPELLASIDDLCNNHFRTTSRSGVPLHLNSRPTQPTTSANLTPLSVSPATVETTSQTFLEEARSPGKLKRSFEGIELHDRGYGVRSFQPGSRNSDGTPSFKNPGIRKQRKRFGNQNEDIPSSYLEWILDFQKPAT
jgi:hypothetical protein